jgi:transposase
MATVVDHLSVDELEERYRACADVTQARHFQTIWLLAKGHTVREVCETMSFGERWIDQVRERYNAFGPDALGDRRCDNGSEPSVLKPELLERLGRRLDDPPPDGGRWTCKKVAFWMAEQLGVEKLSPMRGWEALKALGWSIQRPRPRNPEAATPQEQDEFKKNLARLSPRKRRPIRAFPSRRSAATSIVSG